MLDNSLVFSQNKTGKIIRFEVFTNLLTVLKLIYWLSLNTEILFLYQACVYSIQVHLAHENPHESIHKSRSVRLIGSHELGEGYWSGLGLRWSKHAGPVWCGATCSVRPTPIPCAVFSPCSTESNLHARWAPPLCVAYEVGLRSMSWIIGLHQPGLACRFDTTALKHHKLKTCTRFTIFLKLVNIHSMSKIKNFPPTLI